MLLPELPKTIAKSFNLIYKLFYNKWYFDELYRLIFIKPIKITSVFLWKIIDKKIIDGFGPDGFSSRILTFSKISSKFHTGYVFHYSFSMFLGLAILALILLYKIKII